LDMQVSVETTQGLERRMTVELPADRIENEVKTRLESLAKRVKIHGFRPGKVPFNVVRRQYGTQVQQEVIGDLLQSSFYEAVAKEKLRPASAPNIEPKSRNAGEALQYTATFEIYPEIQLTSTENIAIEKPVPEINEQAVDNVIETIRKQRKEWVTVDRPAQDGDRVKIDFRGTINDEPFSGNEAKDFMVELGSKRMIEGFEDQLVGVKAEEERVLDVAFPENYHSQELAGKQAKFDTKVQTVEEPKLPELTEEFIRSLGVDDGTLESLRKDVQSNMQREADEKVKALLKQRVMDKLLEINQVEIPNALVDKEVDALISREQAQTGKTKSPEEHQALAVRYKDEAHRRVALGLILSELVKQNNIKVEPRKVRELVENIASAYEKPEQVVQWYYADKQRLGDVESLALENEIVEWVISNAKVNETSIQFDELMKSGQTDT
jgi:trigger factor